LCSPVRQFKKTKVTSINRLAYCTAISTIKNKISIDDVTQMQQMQQNGRYIKLKKFKYKVRN